MKRLYRSPSLKKRLRKKEELKIKAFGILLVYILIFSSLSYADKDAEDYINFILKKDYSQPNPGGLTAPIFNDGINEHFYFTEYHDSDKTTVIKDLSNNQIGVLPEGYSVIGRNNGLVFVKTGEVKSELEIGSFKVRLGENAELIVDKGNAKLIELRGSGDVRLGDSLFKDIRNARFEASKEEKYGHDQIIYAEFISNEKGVYTIRYNGENYNFETEAGGYVKFDAKNNRIEGKNAVFDYKGKIAKGDEFFASLDNGKISSMNIKNGAYIDSETNLKYYSDEEFKIVFGDDIKNEKNAVSIIKTYGRTIIQAKGRIKIENGLKYEGLDENVFTTYDFDNKDFTVLNGDAVIENEKHKINFRKGRIFLDNGELSSGSGESFTFSYSYDGEKFYFGKVDEENGTLKLALSNPNHIFLTQIIPFGEYGVDIQRIFKRRSGEVESKTIEAMKSTLEELNAQIESLGENADQELIKSMDLLELRLIQIETKGNYDKTISRVNGYLEKNRDGEAASLAQMQLAEIYQTKATENLINYPYAEALDGKWSLNIKQVSGGFGGAIPTEYNLFFKTKVDDTGKEIVISWSLDGRNFIPMDVEVKEADSRAMGGDIDFSKGVVNLPKKYVDALNELRTNRDINFLKRYKEFVGYKFDGYNAISRKNEEVYSKAMQDLGNAIKFYEEAIKNKDVETEASFGLASTYLQLDRIKEAEELYLNIKNKAENDIAKSYSAMGIATTNLKKGLAGPALVMAYEALDYDPTNEDALALKRQLESSYLEVISRSVNSETEELSKLYEENTGVNSNILQLIVGGKIGRYATGEYDAKTQEYNSLINELGKQERGIILVKNLYNSGLELSEIKKLTYPTENDEIALREVAKIYRLPIDSEDKETRDKAVNIAKELQSSIYYAFLNDDLMKLHEGRGKQGFNFETGEGYVDKEFVKQTGKDIILDIATGMVLTMVPAKAVVSLAKAGTKSLAALEGTSVLARAGRGIGTGLISIGGKGAKLKTTISELNVLQRARELFPKLTGAGEFVGAEAAESTVGLIADKLVPGSGVYTELLTGYGNVFDLSKKIGSGLRKGKVFLTENDEFVYGLGFSDTEQMNQFTWIAEKSPEYKNKIKKLGENLFEVDGKKFLVYDETRGIPEFIGGNMVLENRDIKDILKTGRANINEVSERLTLYERETRNRISKIEEDFSRGEIDVSGIRNKQLELDAKIEELNRAADELEKTEGVMKFIDKKRLGEDFGEGEIKQFVQYKSILKELQQVKNEKRAVDGFLKNIPEVKPKEEFARPGETERISEEAERTEIKPDSLIETTDLKETGVIPNAERYTREKFEGIIEQTKKTQTVPEETVAIPDVEERAEETFERIMHEKNRLGDKKTLEESRLVHKIIGEGDAETFKLIRDAVNKVSLGRALTTEELANREEIVFSVVKDFKAKDFENPVEAYIAFRSELNLQMVRNGVGENEANEIIEGIFKSGEAEKSIVSKRLFSGSWDETMKEREISTDSGQGVILSYKDCPGCPSPTQRMIADLGYGGFGDRTREVKFLRRLIEPRIGELQFVMGALEEASPSVSKYKTLLAKTELSKADEFEIKDLERNPEVKKYNKYLNDLEYYKEAVSREYGNIFNDVLTKRTKKEDFSKIRDKVKQLVKLEEDLKLYSQSFDEKGILRTQKEWRSLANEIGFGEDIDIRIGFGRVTIDVKPSIPKAEELAPLVNINEVFEFRKINDKFGRVGNLDYSTKKRIIEMYEKDPLKASTLVDPKILAKLNLGRSDLEERLLSSFKDPVKQVALKQGFVEFGVTDIKPEAGRVLVPDKGVDYINGRYGIVIHEEGNLVTTLTTNVDGNPVFVTHSKNNKFFNRMPDSLERVINEVKSPEDLNKLAPWLTYKGYEGKNIEAGISDEEVRLLYERCKDCFESVDKSNKLLGRDGIPIAVKLNPDGTVQEATGFGYRHGLKHGLEFYGGLDQIIDSLDAKPSLQIQSHLANMQRQGSSGTSVTLIRDKGKKMAVVVRDGNSKILTTYSAFEEGEHIVEQAGKKVDKSILRTFESIASSKQNQKNLARIFKSKDGNLIVVSFTDTDSGFRYMKKNEKISFELVDNVDPAEISTGTFDEVTSSSQKTKVFDRFIGNYPREDISVDLSSLIPR